MHTVSHCIRTLFYILCYLFMQTTLANIVVIDGPWKAFVQPDGTVVDIRQNGDVNNHWFEDKNGHVLKLHHNTLYYQLRDSDDLIPANAETPENVMIASEKWASFKPSETKLAVIKEDEQTRLGRSIAGRFQVVSVTPTQPLLIIALTFNDSSMNYSKEQHLKKFYGPGSVSEYFQKASFGGFSITPAQETQGTVNDGYIEIKLNMNQPDRFGIDMTRTEIEKELVTDEKTGEIKEVEVAVSVVVAKGIAIPEIRNDILRAVDPYIDFSAYDTDGNRIVEARELAITLIISGWEAIFNSEKKKSTWAHYQFGGKSDKFDNVSIYETSAFGEQVEHNFLPGKNNVQLFYTSVLAHELGHHILGLPDLYTRKGGASYSGWGVMGAIGCCNYNEPLDFSGWAKDQVGFLKPRLHNQSEQRIILKPSHKLPDAYKIWMDPYRHNEYLMLEFKVKEGINTALRDHGLVITHVAEYHPGFNFSDDESTKSVIPILDNRRPYGHSNNGLINVKNRAGVRTDIAITDIKINGTTSVSAQVSAPIADKNSIGYNEAPHLRNIRSTYSGGDRAIIMEVANSALYADGIDLPNTAEDLFEADIRLATSLQAIKDSNYLYSGQCTISKQNWNRCLFPNPVVVRDISPLYVYVHYKSGWYLIDPGPTSGKFYEYFPKRTNSSPNKLSRGDVSMRLLVSGLSPNTPPIFTKTSIDVPVETTFSLDKSTIGTQDPDGDDAHVRVTHLSTTASNINLQKVQYGYVINAPRSMSGKTVQAEIQVSDTLDVTQGKIELRFVGASAGGSNASYESKKEKKKGGGSFEIYWLSALLLLLISAYFAHKHLLRKIK